MSQPDPTPGSRLPPRLGLFSATALIVGSMIGSAIFVAPSTMAQHVQEPGLLLLLWILAGVLTILGACSYAELAAMSPQAGGQYVYLREAFGPMWGFLYGWTLFLVIQTGFNAAVGIAFAKYLGVFVERLAEGGAVLSESRVLVQIPLLSAVPSLDQDILPEFLVQLRINSAQLAACGVIVLLTGINMLGVVAGALVQNVFTVLKVAALAALIVAGSVRGETGSVWTGGGLVTASALGGLAIALSQALFAYDAWNTATFIAEEVRTPERNLPRALLLGTALVTLVYVLTNVAYLSVLPISAMAHVRDNRVAQAAAEVLFGPVGVNLVIGAILVSTFGCLNGLILSGARVFFAMAREGYFFRPCARLQPTTQAPVMALLYQGVWSCVLTLTGTYAELLTYTTFASVFFGCLTVAGVYRLRFTQPDRPRPYRCWGYPITPALYLLLAVPFLVYVIQAKPGPTVSGLVLVLSGLPVYFYWRRRLAQRA